MLSHEQDHKLKYDDGNIINWNMMMAEWSTWWSIYIYIYIYIYFQWCLNMVDHVKYFIYWSSFDILIIMLTIEIVINHIKKWWTMWNIMFVSHETWWILHRRSSSRVHAYGQLFAAAATSNPWRRWDEVFQFTREMLGKCCENGDLTT